MSYRSQLIRSLLDDLTTDPLAEIAERIFDLEAERDEALERIRDLELEVEALEAERDTLAEQVSA